MDSSGRPHVTYHVPFYWKKIDDTTQYYGPNIRYAVKNNQSWTIENAIYLYAGEYGWSYGFALDSDDKPHICYNDNSALKYAYRNGGSWAIEVVDKCYSLTRLSLALDSSNNPHISYLDEHAHLSYAFKSGGEWIVEVVDNEVYPGSVQGWPLSLVLDSNDQPHIACFYGNPVTKEEATIKYVSKSDNLWTFEVVDSDNDISRLWDSQGLGRSFSLVLDTNDNPHIAYKCREYEGTKYAVKKDNAWHIEVIDSIMAGYSISLALDSQDHPHVIYLSPPNIGSATIESSILKYAFKSDTEWTLKTLDSVLLRGSDGFSAWTRSAYGDTSLILDSNDNLHISYLGFIDESDSGTELKYFTYSPATAED